MIRLIASDMDGTLLDDNKKMDSRTLHTIKKLKENHILFAAASGRQAASLMKSFSQAKGDIFFIAENGAVVFHEGKEIYASPIKKELVYEMLKKIETIPKVEPMLCGKKAAYTKNPKTAEIMTSSKFSYEIQLVEDFAKVEEEIVKVSLLDFMDIAKNSEKVMSQFFSDTMEITISGFNCLDLVNKGVSKGEAIRAIQKKFHIAYDETAVFGDNYNDTSMFLSAYYSFAMENAEEGVKKQARFIAGNNNKGAVIDKILALTDLKL